MEMMGLGLGMVVPHPFHMTGEAGEPPLWTTRKSLVQSPEDSRLNRLMVS